MTSTLLTLSFAMAIGQLPFGGYGPAPAEQPGAIISPAGPVGNGYGQEQLYPFDGYEPWLHGHFQEIPAYGGYRAFRPYNYRHVLAQSQVAGGWGMSPATPYSQEYFRKLRDQASLEQRLSRFEAAYSRAQAVRGGLPQDFQIVDGRVAPLNGSVVTNLPAPPPGSTRQAIDPAMYTSSPQPGRVAAIQEQLRQQELQRQALEHALQDEYRRGASSPGGNVLAAPGP